MYQILVDRFYNGDPANDVLTDEYYYIQTPSKKWRTGISVRPIFLLESFTAEI